jgi:zinc and cadmium transporter
LRDVLLYSLVIVAGALGGAAVPLVSSKERHLYSFLAFAAGVMLGAAFFHMLPEAFRGGGGYAVFSLAALGFFALFVLERYVFVHVCEEPASHEHANHRAPHGMLVLLGLSVHTLFDGVAIGSAVQEGVGLTTFLAVTAHKVPSALTLSSIMLHEGRRPAQILGYAFVFGCMVPLGAGLYYLLQSKLLRTSVAPQALAFSAGTFLYIAVADLLPHVRQGSREGRIKRVGAFALGLASMFALSVSLRG